MEKSRNKGADLKKIALDGMFGNNPVFVQLLGTCSVLAVTTSLQNGFGMAVAVIAVLICSNIAISLLRKIIPNEVRIASFIVVIAGFVSAVELLMKAYTPDLSKALGVFIPLIVVNCIILARAESFASKNGVLASLVDGLFQGVGYTIAICVVSAIRELLGNGTLMGIQIFGDGYQPAIIFLLPAGAFFVLGSCIALYQFIMRKIKEAPEKKRLKALAIQRAADAASPLEPIIPLDNTADAKEGEKK